MNKIINAKYEFKFKLNYLINTIKVYKAILYCNFCIKYNIQKIMS